MRRLSAVAVALCLAASFAHAEGTREAVAHVQAAFSQGDANSLRPVLSDDRKTYVSLKGLCRQEGHFGSSQVYYIFAKVFARHESVSARGEARKPQGSTLHARLDWRYTKSDSGEPGAAVILMTFEKTEGGYVLVDIRSAAP